MKRFVTWIITPVAVAALAAVTPLNLSASEGGFVSVKDAVCLDCKEDPAYTCGSPPLDREDHCTVGEPHCKANAT